MSKEGEPIDRRMVIGGKAFVKERPWCRPSRLTGWFLTVVVLDALVLLYASGLRSVDNDAAGNGMANAFQAAFVAAGAVLVGCLALLFAIVRHKPTRIGLTVVLVLMSLLLPVLLQ